MKKTEKILYMSPESKAIALILESSVAGGSISDLSNKKPIATDDTDDFVID